MRKILFPLTYWVSPFKLYPRSFTLGKSSMP